MLEGKEKYLRDNPELLDLYQQLQSLHDKLGAYFMETHARLPSMPDFYSDRWERAQKYGWGDGTSVYDSALILGEVNVGQECWIGPFTVLDGSGSLSIGDYCTISAGVQIYTHDNVASTQSSKKEPIDCTPVTIGNNVYIGPNAVIAKGVKIGDGAKVGALAFVKDDVDAHQTVVGQPARPISSPSVDL